MLLASLLGAGLISYIRRGLEAATIFGVNVMRLQAKAPLHTYVLITLFWPLCMLVDGPANKWAVRYLSEVLVPRINERNAATVETVEDIRSFISTLDAQFFGDDTPTNGHTEEPHE